ncbi:MAG: phosphatidylserine/phosphatidylglycerophosphate/cardiolipin synthase family protein [Hyphomicrobiales bacterium]|nr:MAG: phosphatidylserine/phosphatidylglycerophosphate/cardiolipin synthase family protein [Hyphomicrobiales bacterium]
MEAIELHARLKALINEWADFEGRGRMSAEANAWLGKVHALVEAADNGADSLMFGNAVQSLGGNSMHESNVQTIRAILFRTLAKFELQMPTAAQGSFIAAASPFDVFASLSKILVVAKTDVLIIDPYIDAVALTDVAVLVPEGVPVRLLGDSANAQANLAPALARWRIQHTTRSVEARMASPKALHDRMIIVDCVNAWSLSQSIKDFAKRSHASIERSEPEIAAMKKLAYDDGIWIGATPVA